MPEGKCVVCGQVYAGWGLRDAKDPVCDYCGGKIILVEERNAEV